MRHTKYDIQDAECDIQHTIYEIASTTVENPLQISPFLQNKPNFRKSQMNKTNVLTRDYENKTLGGSGKTNPKQTQFIMANL